MKKFSVSALMTLWAGTAYASTQPPVAVPEIDALAGFSALAVIGSVAALIWERRRK